MSDLHNTLPGLDALDRDPAKLAELSVESVEALLARCHTLEGRLLARLLAARANGHSKPEPPESRTLLTIAEAAKRANLPESWIRQAVKDGRLPSVKLGHYRRIKHDDLERLLITKSK